MDRHSGITRLGLRTLDSEMSDSSPGHMYLCCILSDTCGKIDLLRFQNMVAYPQSMPGVIAMRDTSDLGDCISYF